MLQPAKIVTIALGLVSLNAGLVIWSVVDRYAFAQPQQATEPTGDGPTSGKTASEENVAASAMQPPTHQQLLDSVPPPTLDQLPAVAPPVNFEADAGFQQFLLQAEEVIPQLTNSHLLNASSTPEETVQSASNLAGSKKTRTIRTYNSIESHLQIVGQLNEAMLGLSREASQSASAGDLQRAEELMHKVAYLRQLAAELLLEPR